MSGLGRVGRGLGFNATLVILHNLLFVVLAGGLFVAVRPGSGRRAVFLTLAVVYVLSVLGLELYFLPRYIHRPLARLSELDERVAVLTRQLDDARTQVARQDRLASLGLTAAGVAHEMNTPVSVLRGSIESMLEECREESAQRKLHRMLRVTERLEGISASLLQFSNPRPAPAGTVSTRAVVDEAWALVSWDPKSASVRFVNRVREEDRVTGNAGRLSQVFVNLLRNAVLAVQSGGTITAVSRTIQERGREWVCISVEDNGPGIPPDILPRVFEAFVSGHRSERGTGLGLTVAEGIVLEHGGLIGAANLPDGGARFEVRLPTTQMGVAV
jgi:signal transduction histidine kinase